MSIGGVANIANLGNVAGIGPTNDVIQIGNDGGFSWITFENRGCIPVGIQPSYYGSAGGMPMGFTAPALYRSTLPIDPTQDVYISSQFRQLPNDDADITAKTYNYLLGTIGVGQGTARPVNCPYLLHDDGAPASVSLYPIESWRPSVIGDLSAVNTNPNIRAATSYCGLNLTSTGQFTIEQYLGGGGQDTVIMALSFTLKDGLVPAGAIVALQLFGYYQSGALPTGNLMQDMVIFTPSDPLGTVVTLRTSPGAQFMRLRLLGFAGTEAMTIGSVAWLGVPAN
jgi:hypothetical protein